jgi:hypothetical protein
MTDEEIERVKQVTGSSSNVVGAAVGNTLGFILADAPGAFIGGAFGASLTGVLKQVFFDVATRRLSKREETRVGTSAYFAVEKIQARLNAGELPREDGFFDKSDLDSRSYADEIFEGILLKSKNEHEEKKIKFIANIFANTTFHSEISSSEANHLLQVAENMTYRQMGLLALFERKAELEGIHLADRDYSSRDNEDNVPIINDLSALQEVYQLYNSGLVACKFVEQVNSDGWTESVIVTSQNYLAFNTFEDVIPNQMILTNLGKRYYSIMSLSEISKEDLREVAKTLCENII